MIRKSSGNVTDVPIPGRVKYQDMSSSPLTSMSSTSFAYIECDIPEGQTLVEWRRDLEAARRVARPPRRRLLHWIVRWSG